MPNIFTIGQHAYDLDIPAQLNACLANMGTVINRQATTIENLRATPGMNPQQLTELIAAIRPGQANANGVENPVLSTPGNNIAYEEHSVPAGMDDVKGFPTPDPFSGQQTDAAPFIIRLKAYCTAKPKAMRFTRNRILFACDLLKNYRSHTWSKLVRRSIAEETNNDYYYDSWEDFLAEFLKRYGLVNETQHWYQLMTNCEQENGTDCKAYIDEFERRRVEAKTTKENAFYFLKKGNFTKATFTLCLTKIENSDMVESLQPETSTSTNYEPMDVDAVKHVKPKPTNKSLRKKEDEPRRQNRLPPHPSSSNRRLPPPKPREPYRKRPLYCFVCDQPGHFAKECKAKINEIKITHIQQLGLALEESMYSESQEGDLDDEEELEKWIEEDEDEDDDDHQKDLITFNTDDNSTEPDF
ncbi:hypothetical protein BDM02DRAFT_3193205 [Thelephora ganbajun]|uniref:Uncharacterized protein n=1 Tax=Thelephora ganbajun TaxID=370292 RepID=A0ACB6YZ14_THEGA|nr:hypothetical protein BDM02DRAFT_3193205 [Thelephora ganbajun]